MKRNFVISLLIPIVWNCATPQEKAAANARSYCPKLGAYTDAVSEDETYVRGEESQTYVQVLLPDGTSQELKLNTLRHAHDLSTKEEADAFTDLYRKACGNTFPHVNEIAYHLRNSKEKSSILEKKQELKIIVSVIPKNRKSDLKRIQEGLLSEEDLTRKKVALDGKLGAVVSQIEDISPTQFIVTGQASDKFRGARSILVYGSAVPTSGGVLQAGFTQDNYFILQNLRDTDIATPRNYDPMTIFSNDFYYVGKQGRRSVFDRNPPAKNRGQLTALEKKKSQLEKDITVAENLLQFAIKTRELKEAQTASESSNGSPK